MTAADETIDHTPSCTVRLDLPARPVSIAVARSVIRRIVTFRDQDTQSAYLVALTEIMSNAIEEHQRVGTDAPIEVVIECGSVERVTVSDSGAGMDGIPDGSTPDVTIERGRGLTLARAFVPDIDFATGPSGTTVTLPLAGFGIVR